jgi:hypothetical protein
MHTTRCIMRPRCLLWVHTIQISIGLLLRPKRETEQIHTRLYIYIYIYETTNLSLCAEQLLCSWCLPSSLPSLGPVARSVSRRDQKALYASAPAAQKSNLQPHRLRRSVNTGDRSVILEESAHCSRLNIYMSHPVW